MTTGPRTQTRQGVQNVNPASRQPVPPATRTAKGTSVQGRSAPGAGAARSALLDVVPFITRWSAEVTSAASVVVRRDGKGIGYADERSYDRVDGILWARTPSQPGRGKPQFGAVHSLRQRLTMTSLLCHICGQPADRNPDGLLWLIDAQPHDLHPGKERTTHPPICRPCAQLSIRRCPHLRHAWTLLRVHTFRMCGVQGALYTRGQGTPVPVDAGSFEFTSPALPWVRASQLIAELQDFTVTDL